MSEQIPESTIVPENVTTITEAESEAQNKKAQVVIAIVAIVIVLMLVGSLIFLLTAPAEVTAQIRDVFIIVMAFESLFLGLVLTILIIQLARLTNLLQNELRPILLLLNETISNIKGTGEFISDNVAEPIIKLNSYMAGVSEFLVLLGLLKKSKKSSKDNGDQS